MTTRIPDDAGQEAGGFETHDLDLGATLATLGHPVARLAWRGRRCWFGFGPAEGLAPLVERYHTGRLLVEPRAFAENLRTLKAALHAPNGGRS